MPEAVWIIESGRYDHGLSRSGQQGGVNHVGDGWAGIGGETTVDSPGRAEVRGRVKGATGLGIVALHPEDHL